MWDLRSSGENAGNPNAIIFAQKVKSAPSPNGPQNVDWTELKKVSGGLSNLVYRVETVGGQPPATVRFCLYFVLILSTNIYFFVVHPRD